MWVLREGACPGTSIGDRQAGRTPGQPRTESYSKHGSAAVNCSIRITTAVPVQYRYQVSYLYLSKIQ